MIRLLLPFVALFLLCYAKINANEPLAVSISPKIWNLLTTKANFISNAVTSIRFPDFDGKKSLVKYRVWDGRVDHFSVPQSGVSFQDMANGVHLSIKNVQFHATVRGRVELGKKVFGKFVRIARMSGDIKAKSENAGLDIKLVWNDFKFTPTVTMNSNVRVDFTHNLKRYLGFMRGKLQSAVTSKVNSEVPKKLVKVIEEKVNPRLQKLKQKIIAMGITQYGIEWKIQNNILKVTLKPKNAGTASPVQPMNKMLCIDANILAAIPLIPRQKRKSWFKKKWDKIRGKKQQQPAPATNPPQTTPAPKRGFDFSCVAPQFSCKGLACSYCTDVDVNPSSTGPEDKFHNCLPEF